MNNLLKVIDFINDTDKKFDLLADSIHNCKLCPCMEHRTKVFSECNGNINSNVLFIAEAPGRLGADRTAIPLFGDQTGVNFQRLIDTIGWSRKDFFITNSILCNPRDEAGNNSPPSIEHIKNCSVYLDTLIKVMKPEYVITLGNKALNAIQLLAPIEVRLREQVRTVISWNGLKLIPLYHTGPRAQVHRSYYNQLADFYWVKQQVKINAKPWYRLKESRLSNLEEFEKFSPSKMQKIIFEIMSRVKTLSEFKLTKMLYLSDYNYLKSNGKLLTNSFYLRAYNGPLPMGLDKQITQLINYGFLRKTYATLEFINVPKIALKDDEKAFVQKIIEMYGQLSDKEIKTTTYLTKPMKRILKTEKKGSNMLWHPVFSDEDLNPKIIQE